MNANEDVRADVRLPNGNVIHDVTIEDCGALVDEHGYIDVLLADGIVRMTPKQT